MKPLTDKTILITRPVHAATELKEALSDAGATVLHVPVMEIVALDQDADAAAVKNARSILERLRDFHHVIFISANAVEQGLALMNDICPQLPTNINWYGIGKVTAQKLIDQGLPAQASDGNMTSEDMLGLPSLQQIAGDNILIVRGVGGRGYLAEQLTQRGAKVETVECYRRRCPESGLELNRLFAKKAAEINAVCVSSGESLQNLCALANRDTLPKLLVMPLLVPSLRVEQQAAELGFANIFRAENAGSDATVKALINM